MLDAKFLNGYKIKHLIKTGAKEKLWHIEYFTYSMPRHIFIVKNIESMFLKSTNAANEQ